MRTGREVRTCCLRHCRSNSSCQSRCWRSTIRCRTSAWCAHARCVHAQDVEEGCDHWLALHATKTTTARWSITYSNPWTNNSASVLYYSSKIVHAQPPGNAVFDAQIISARLAASPSYKRARNASAAVTQCCGVNNEVVAPECGWGLCCRWR